MVITDSAALRDFEKAFVADGGRGFTLIPQVLGSGETGLKAGNRVHPGASSLLFTRYSGARVIVQRPIAQLSA